MSGRWFWLSLVLAALQQGLGGKGGRRTPLVDPIEGWFNAQNVTGFMLNAILAAGIDQGAVAEIGVHHGKSFIHMLSYGIKGRLDPFVAIDVFDNQALNRDGSGLGSRETFMNNVQGYTPNQAELVRTISGSSMDLTPAQTFNATNGRRVAFFSVDGCHDFLCTTHDLHLAFGSLHDQGLIMLDDVYNSAWPGVAMGAAAFLQAMQYKAVGIAYGQNKFYIAKAGAANFYVTKFREFCKMYDSRGACNRPYCGPCVLHEHSLPDNAVTFGSLLELRM